MDQRAYIDPITGRTLAIIDGQQYLIYVNDGLEIGERIFRDKIIMGVPTVEVRHTDDLVWDLVWKNFLTSERVKAHRFLRNKAIEVRVGLGFPRVIPYTFPLPFDEYSYNFS